MPTRLQSGADDIPRPLSSGLQTFSTNKEKWPVTQPLPKTDSKLQVHRFIYICDLDIATHYNFFFFQ